MKRNFITKLFFFLSLFFLTSFTENTIVPDSRIAEAFGQKHVDFLLKNNPDLISYYNFYLDKSYRLVEMPAKPSKQQILEVKLKSEYQNVKSSKFNILLYDVKRDFDKNTYYNYHGKLLVMLSEREFMELYNAHKKKQINR